MPIDIFGRTSNTVSKAQKASPMYSPRSQEYSLHSQEYPDTKHFLKHDGSVTASAPLDMSGNTIKNLPFPNDLGDAVNRDFVDAKIYNLDAALREYIDRVIAEKVREAMPI